MNIRLDGKNALCCGASKGIGYAIALRLAECGANVCLLAREEKALAKALKTMPKNENQTHSFIAADFQKTYETIGKISEKFPKDYVFHILVNNTGGPPPGALLDAKPDDFLFAFERHLLMSHKLVKCVADGMKKAGFGRIINVISMSVRTPIKNLGVSNTVRGAMASWAKTLSNELAPYGITVNNLLPGAIKTQRLDSLHKNIAKSSGISFEDAVKATENQIPAGRIGTTEEIGAVGAFLASEQASYVTGSSIAVDGGRIPCV